MMFTSFMMPEVLRLLCSDLHSAVTQVYFLLPKFWLSSGIPSCLGCIPLSCHVCFHLLSTFMRRTPFSQEISCAIDRPAGVSYQMLWLLISSSSIICLAQDEQVIFRICCKVLINNSL